MTEPSKIDWSQYSERYLREGVLPAIAAESDRIRMELKEQREQRASLLKRSGISLLDADFDAVRDQTLAETEALKVVNAWWKDQNRRPWLALSGGTGVGKTLALAHVAARTIARYVTAEELGRVWSANFGPQYEDQTAIRKTCCLLIDDVGTELDARMLDSALLALISGRSSARDTPTILTTNMSASAFATTYANGRIHSRMNTHVQWVTLIGSDMRRQK